MKERVGEWKKESKCISNQLLAKFSWLDIGRCEGARKLQYNLKCTFLFFVIINLNLSYDLSCFKAFIITLFRFLKHTGNKVQDLSNH